MSGVRREDFNRAIIFLQRQRVVPFFDPEIYIEPRLQLFSLAAKLTRMCQDRGLRTRAVGTSLAFSPPLSISEDEVDEIVRILGSVLDTVA